MRKQKRLLQNNVFDISINIISQIRVLLRL